MNDGTCNAIAAEAITLNPTRLRLLGLFQGINFTLGENTFSRDPLALTTRDGDPDWSDLVNSVIKILYTGEALNLTAENVEDRMLEYEGKLDEDLLARVVRVISLQGHYGELYTRKVSFVVERQGANLLNTGGDTGLVYSYPFGNVFRESNGIVSDVMEMIQNHGFIKCGISLAENRYAAYDESTDTYSGIDVEYCRALAAGIFVGDSTLVEFTVLNASSTFQALAAGTIDVLAGQQITLANEFSEPSTGKSFAFSEPYFRDVDGATRALVTRRDDDVWSSFVYWTLTALVYAEESGITSSLAIHIPPVSLFGERHLQSFRDSIASVGNYGEIYDRTIGSLLERSATTNQLNAVPYGPQQVGYPLI